MLGSLMEKEIAEQPALLEENSERYFGELQHVLAKKNCEMVLIAARGSSDHAALYARYLIEIHLGIPVSLAAPSVLTRYHATVRYPKCLAIGISQSGAAPDVAEVIDALRSQGHVTLGITNEPNSRLSEAAEHTLLLGVGEERSVAATKTYSGSLLALYQLVRAMGGNLPAPESALPNQQWLDEAKSWSKDAANSVIRAKTVFALARGYDFCTALETALKLMECALLPAKGYSTADFHHGPKAVAGPQALVVGFGELGDIPCPVAQAPSPPVLDSLDALWPIWNIVCGQCLALEVAQRLGLDPDHPPNLHKITSTR